jgi:hypothetical protein
MTDNLAELELLGALHLVHTQRIPLTPEQLAQMLAALQEESVFDQVVGERGDPFRPVET